MFVSPRLCAVQSAGQIAVSSSQLKLNFRIKPKIRPQGTKASKRLNVGELRLPSTSQYFADILEERLNSIVLD